MKKLTIVFCVILILACAFSAVPAFSADTDFIVEDSVLLSYTGSSESVTVPSSVTAIASSAFENNTTIKSIKLHNKVYTIGDKAFYGCTSLKTVSGGSGVKYVGALSFVETAFLSSSTDEFVILGSVLLCYNGTGASVTLPDSITCISPYAFLRNTRLTSFKSGSNLKAIGEGAFYECSALKTVSVIDSVSFIGADAFKGTKWLSSKSGFVTLGDGILIAYNGSSTALKIPTTVNQIAPNAFYSNTKVTSVDVPSSVFAIGARAFMSCSNLSDVKLSYGLVMIDDEAFANCSKLKSIATPMTLSKIGKGAFINCTKLSQAQLQGNRLSIDYGAFAYCGNLELAFISNSAVAVGNDVFSNDTKLSFVTAPSGLLVISPDSFSGVESLTVLCDEGSFAHSALKGTFECSFGRGDVGRDGELDILDATIIQRHIACIETLSMQKLAFADADFDATVSVLDATYIQRYIAKLL